MLHQLFIGIKGIGRYKQKFFKNSSTKDQVVKNVLNLIGNDDLSLRMRSCSNPDRLKMINQNEEL